MDVIAKAKGLWSFITSHKLIFIFIAGIVIGASSATAIFWSQLGAAGDIVRKSEADVSQLGKQISDITAEIVPLRASLADYIARNSQLNSRLGSVTQGYQDLQRRFGEIKNQLDSANAGLDNLKLTVSGYEARIAGYQRQIDELTKGLSDYIAIITAVSNRLDSTDTGVGSVADRLRKLATEVQGVLDQN